VASLAELVVPGQSTRRLNGPIRCSSTAQAKSSAGRISISQSVEADLTQHCGDTLHDDWGATANHLGVADFKGLDAPTSASPSDRRDPVSKTSPQVQVMTWQ
jgi:hypothetical protein